jgi:hypothetical protein
MFDNGHDAKRFTLAGKAVLTLVSQKTEKRYTYRVSQAHDRVTGAAEDKWFVGLLTGPDNNSDYTYVGLLTPNWFRLTKGSKFAADSIPVRAFNYFWKHAGQEQLAPDLEVHHCEHCGACGRLLTTPESTKRGIGPECAAKLGLT